MSSVKDLLSSFHGTPHEGNHKVEIRVAPQGVLSDLLFMGTVEGSQPPIDDLNAGVVLCEVLFEGAGADHDPGNIRIDAEHGDGSMAIEQPSNSPRGHSAAFNVIVED